MGLCWWYTLNKALVHESTTQALDKFHTEDIWAIKCCISSCQISEVWTIFCYSCIFSARGTEEVEIKCDWNVTRLNLGVVLLIIKYTKPHIFIPKCTWKSCLCIFYICTISSHYVNSFSIWFFLLQAWYYVQPPTMSLCKSPLFALKSHVVPSQSPPVSQLLSVLSGAPHSSELFC